MLSLEETPIGLLSMTSNISLQVLVAQKHISLCFSCSGGLAMSISAIASPFERWLFWESLALRVICFSDVYTSHTRGFLKLLCLNLTYLMLVHTSYFCENAFGRAAMQGASCFYLCIVRPSLQHSFWTKLFICLSSPD